VKVAPPLWRVWAGLIATPALPVGAFVTTMTLIDGRDDVKGIYDALLMVLIFGVLWAPPAAAAAGLYFGLRSRLSMSLRVCVAGWALIMPIVPLIMVLMPSSAPLQGLGLIALLVGIGAVTGAVCGLVFWVIAIAGAKPPVGAEAYF